MLPATNSSNLAGNIGRVVLVAVQRFGNASAKTATVTFLTESLHYHGSGANSPSLLVHTEPSSLMFGGSGSQSKHIITESI